MKSSLQRRRHRDPEIALFPSNANPIAFTTVRRRHKKRYHFKASPAVVSCIFGFSILLLLSASRFFGALHSSSFSFHAHTSGQPEIYLPIANVDIYVPNATEWPLIHIVNTRFMQQQGHLSTLGMARLHLFETFCLPTMVGQSTQQFLWIIKTDPKLDKKVLDCLLELVQPYSNIYVVASNQNFLISPDLVGSWRDGAEGRDLLASTIYSGNLTKLHQAIALREDRPILETRLDADDGLDQHFLEYVQSVATQRFLGRDKEVDDDSISRDDESPRTVQTPYASPRWMYWCARRHVEWRSGPMNQSSPDEVSFPFGILNPVEHSKLCITPGITVGYNSGTTASEVPCESHDVLYKHLLNSTSCYDGTDPSKIRKQKKGKPLCLDFVQNSIFSAIRARTWTSAGMQAVTSPDGYIPASAQKDMTEMLWNFLEKRFDLNPKLAQETKLFLYEHQAQIAYENLLGQCTSFHSCKQTAKEALEQYINEAGDTGIHILPQSG
jgi:Putative rhamnosyl transferase